MEQCRSVLRVTEAELDAGGNEAGRFTKIEADALMDHDVNGVTLGDEESDEVGKLQLPALPGFDAVRGIESRAVQ